MDAKYIEKKLAKNCTKMRWAILNKSWKQHPLKQLYGHQLPISKTIQIRWTRHVGYCWKSKDKIINDVFLWTPSHGCVSVGQRTRSYLQHLCMDTGCSLKDLPEAMEDKDKWRERIREIHANSVIYIYIYIYIMSQFYSNSLKFSLLSVIFRVCNRIKINLFG